MGFAGYRRVKTDGISAGIHNARKAWSIAFGVIAHWVQEWHDAVPPQDGH